MKNINKAIAILKGTTVVAHDRRAATASPVPFKRVTIGGRPALKPEHGISFTMQNELRKLAKDVAFVATKRGRTMPAYIF